MKKRTKEEMLAAAVSNSERRRIERQVPDDSCATCDESVDGSPSASCVGQCAKR